MKIKNIQKEAFLSNLEKSYSEGVYVDNAQNRKLGRVGMSYKQYKEKVNVGNPDKGYWEEFVDEDTGEVVKMWVTKPTKKEEKEFLKKRKKEIEEEHKKYQIALKKEKEIQKKYFPLSEELFDLQSDLKDKLQQYRELEMDQEEELGPLYAQGKDKEAEELAQKYGEQLGDLDSEINSLKSKIKELEPKVDKLHEELNSIWDY